MERTIDSIRDFIDAVPKAELHLHIEGTLEPELLFAMARRNRVTVKYRGIEELRAAYSFSNLQEFLDLYYAGASVLMTEEDFFDLTMAYLERAAKQRVVHTEIFFDPQTHIGRGLLIEPVVRGISQALEEGSRTLGISSRLILCFLRHLSEESALETLEQARPFRHLITGVGLDSSENGNPPRGFRRVFAMAMEQGYLPVVHAGEEGPPDYVWEALHLLKAKRIDHGVRSLEDPELVNELVARQIPLTVCPLSNLKLKVVSGMQEHPLKTMLDLGMKVTIHSDDPAYFGGYISENYKEAAEALSLSLTDIHRMAVNAFEASFLEEGDRKKWIRTTDELYRQFLEL